MKNELNYDEDFLVSQLSTIQIVWCIINIIVAAISLMFILFVGVGLIAIIAFAASIAGVYKAYQKLSDNKTIIRISKDGFFYKNILLTNWANYKKSFYKREMDDVNPMSENTYLTIEYYKPNESGFFRKKIELGNEDKDENDIMNAIEFYYNESLKK